MKNNTSKRFWLFEGSWYYPGGGMTDFFGSFDSIDECIKGLVDKTLEDYSEYYNQTREEFVKSELDCYKWAHILDTQDGNKSELDFDEIDFKKYI